MIVGGGIAGLLTAYKLIEFKPLVFDRRWKAGKKCTGIISESTFERLGISKEFIDYKFKEIEIVYNNKYSVYIRANIIRLNREKLEEFLDREVNTIRPRNVNIINNYIIMDGKEKYEGLVINASGWKGKCKWIRAIEYTQEPINEDRIIVHINSKNMGGFGWIVPLPDRTLVGALSYQNPNLFIPRLDKRIFEIHGGAIPRVKPKIFNDLRIGDSTGLIKTFTGGGIFSISLLLDPLIYGIKNNSWEEYNKAKLMIIKEITKQYLITSFLERLWKSIGFIFKLYKDKTIYVDKQFDFHSHLFSFLTKL
ncbi:MAG: NAD(P)-binding protein [Sulfolobaceae archaeon]